MNNYEERKLLIEKIVFLSAKVDFLIQFVNRKFSNPLLIVQNVYRKEDLKNVNIKDLRKRKTTVVDNYVLVMKSLLRYTLKADENYYYCSIMNLSYDQLVEFSNDAMNYHHYYDFLKTIGYLMTKLPIPLRLEDLKKDKEILGKVTTNELNKITCSFGIEYSNDQLDRLQTKEIVRDYILYSKRNRSAEPLEDEFLTPEEIEEMHNPKI